MTISIKYLALVSLSEKYRKDEIEASFRPLAEFYCGLTANGISAPEEWIGKLEALRGRGDGEGEWSLLEVVQGFKHDFSGKREAAASALLIVAARELHRFYQRIYSAYAYAGVALKHHELRDRVYCAGPTIKGSCHKWAELIVAGSNYVRHRDEWRLFLYRKDEFGKLVPRSEGELLEDLGELQKKSVLVLQKNGIAVGDILGGRDVGHEVVSICDLESASSYAETIGNWSSEVIKMTKADIGDI